MSEMLANHYYLTGNFSKALLEFEKIVVDEPKRKCFKRKLMICYLQTARYDEALKLFTELISDSIDYLSEDNDSNESCPCKDLITKIQSEKNFTENFESLIKLGVLWANYDLSISFEMFRKALIIDNTNEHLNFVIHTYEKSLRPKTINKQFKRKNEKK